MPGSGLDAARARAELIRQLTTPPPVAPVTPDDPKGLEAAIRKSGLTGKRTTDIELKPDALSYDELMRRANAIATR